MRKQYTLNSLDMIELVCAGRGSDHFPNAHCSQECILLIG